MQELINALSNPGTMSTSQWLVFAIGSLIVLGALYFILKLYKLIKGIGKTTYTPNIGITKHPYKGQPVSKSDEEGSEGETYINSDTNDSDSKTEF